MEEIPHRPDLDLGSLLEGHDLDVVMSVVANLVAEVVELRERVAALEGGAAEEGLQDRIDAFIARVFSPLRADSS